MAVLKQRRRSNDGHASAAFSVFARVPKALEADYYAHRAEEAAQAKAEKAAKVEKKRGRLGLPEETVLAMRALKEYRGWTTKQLMAFYGEPYTRTYQIISYIIGGGRVPTPQHVPEDAVPPVVEDRRGRPKKAAPAPLVPMMANTYASLQAAQDDPEFCLSEGG